MSARQPSETRGKRPRRFYTPGPWVQEAPGVKRTVREHGCDLYTGTAEALAAAGLLPRHLFPGQPGVGRTSASYWPEGSSGTGWRCSGHLQVRRRPDEQFSIELVVPEHERERRATIRQELERQRALENEARRQAVLPVPMDAERASRRLLEFIGREMGSAWLRREVETMSKPATGRPRRGDHLRLVWSAQG